MPNAREKLNSAAVNGVLALAVFVGLTTQSLIWGCLAFAILLGLALHSGDIRLKPNTSRK